MDRSSAVSLLLLLVGLGGGIVAVSAGVVGSNVDRLATGLVLVTSAALAASGGSTLVPRWTETSLASRVPAGGLLVFGVGSVVGGLISFAPLRSTVNQGLQALLVGGLVVTGAGLALAAWRWARRGERRYPLALLSGGLVLGLAYIATQLTTFGVRPALVVVWFVAVPLSILLGGAAARRPATTA